MATSLVATALDNTPLEGVTGGGLPAEIWHEVMVRVEEGLPVTDLPMIIPAPRQPPQPEGQPVEDFDQPFMDADQPYPQDAPMDPIESLLRDILGIQN